MGLRKGLDVLSYYVRWLLYYELFEDRSMHLTWDTQQKLPQTVNISNHIHPTLHDKICIIR